MEMENSSKKPGKQKKLRKRRSDKRKILPTHGQLFVRKESTSSFCFSDDSPSEEFESSSYKRTYTSSASSALSAKMPLIEGPSFSKFLSSSGNSASTLPDLEIEEDRTWMKEHPTAMKDIRRMTAILERQRREKSRNDWRKKFFKSRKYHGAVFCNHGNKSVFISFCDKCTNRFRLETNVFFNTAPKPSAGSALRAMESD